MVKKTGRYLRIGMMAGMALLACTPVKNFVDPQGPLYSGEFSPPAPALKDQIKVVSFNIKLGQKIEQATQELQENEGLRDADIILLQEMNAEAVEFLARRLKYNFIYYPASIHTKHDKDYGNAILSRWPIKDPQKIILPYEHPFRKLKRIAAVATIVVGEYEILTYCVHTEMFWLNNPKRLEQAEAIIASVPPGVKYVIVGGDFNTELPRLVEETESVFDKAGFTRVSGGIGFTSQADPLGLIQFELDHIFVKGLTLVESGKLENTRASDHLPIWAVVKFTGS